MEQYIGIPPRGPPLASRWMCFVFPRFSNWHRTYSRIYWAVLKMKRTYPSGSQKRKKQEKEEKRKHDSGKLSEGDKIDLIIII